MSRTTEHSAGGSMAGYLFQCRLALLRGLQMVKRKPAGHIHIEKFDDIAFEDDDLSKCLIQAKHSIKAKSLSDSSVDLWKSLKVWIDQFKAGTITYSETKFLLVTTATAHEESAAANLRPDASDENRQTAFSLLRAAAEKSSNVSTQTAREAFLSLDQSQASALLSNIEVIDSHPNLIDVMSEIEGELIIVAPSHPELAAAYLEGWWLNVVAKCLIEASSASIPLQHIMMKAHEIGKTISDDSLPIDEPSALNVKDYSHDDESQMFVRQMRLVDMPEPVVQRGVEDYYRASAQRSKWARESLLLDDELGRYDDRLTDRWARQFEAEQAMSQTVTDKEKIQAGKQLCIWATQQSTPLRNVVETWITAGSYHGLSDRLIVGWHPDYQSVLGDSDNG